MLVIVSYDIVSDRRRNRVHNRLKDYGERVQYSVFECRLKPAELAVLRKELSALVSARTDRVRYYQLCENCQARTISCGPPPEH
ncbi:MAG TPA: CRISPR-associated endonuclease Cas2 [candidate division WOR-3 bacterium]|uniref:CRISPR-associated endoribonuclease Cas2 n=1 Tax=candidate division WOR-3 bacterium TaxID=2052148 RepID=A0A7V0T647_UNCW3|nr:CRISPR-associated endonuclease Cas2 [candidate division WOR-3 bacterium]